MRFKFIICIVIIFTSFISFFGQSTFTPEPEKFLKDVQNFLSDYDKSKAKDFVKSFEPPTGEFFNANMKSHVYATLNKMVYKGFKLILTFYLILILFFIILNLECQKIILKIGIIFLTNLLILQIVNGLKFFLKFLKIYLMMELYI